MRRLHLWLNLEPQLSKDAHAAPTSTDDIDEKLTNMINMLDSYTEIFSPSVSQFECGTSSSSAAHAAPTSTDGILEQLTNICESIEKRTEELAKRCVEGALPPSLTSPTEPEQVPSKRRRRTRYDGVNRVRGRDGTDL